MAIVSHMRWHAEHHTKDGEMIHPSNAHAWLTFNDTHPDFSMETQNVRHGLCIDSFNPLKVRENNIHHACDCYPIKSSALDVLEEFVYVLDSICH